MDVDWLVGEDEAVAYVVPLHAEAQALHVLRRAGLSPRSTGNAMPGGLHAMIGRDDTTVAIVVPKADVAEAKTLLLEWEDEGEAQVREHLGRLPFDLARAALAGGLVYLVVWLASGPSRSPGLHVLAVAGLVGAGLLGEWIRRRR